jgi:hypothetical protein
MPTSPAGFHEYDRHKQATTEFRNRALERLYTRMAVVDDLIRSLENYERFPVRKGPAQCIPIRKYSSDSAQSQI